MSVLSARHEAPVFRPEPYGMARVTTSDVSHIMINGRFLTQRRTGVQRYAYEIASRLGRLSNRESQTLRVVAPPGACQPSKFDNTSFHQTRLVRGHLWEQCILPFTGSGPVLNFCNSAPILSGRSIVCIHDCNVFTAPESYSFLFRTCYRRLLPALARRKTQIVTVSKTAAVSIAQTLQIPLQRIHILPNGHEHALAWTSADPCCARPSGNSRPYVLLIGSLAKHKNMRRVLDLARPLDELGLGIKVVGAAGPAFQRTSVPTAGNIDWLGPIDDAALAYHLDGALCLAFPSTSEGFGLPVLEAMARGCPVIASDRSSLPEVCGGAALLANPFDGSPWLRHIKSLVQSRQLRAELSEAGKLRSQSYSWETSAQGYLDLASRCDG